MSPETLGLQAARRAWWQTWPHKIFKFFASLKLAIMTLLALMAVLAAGTFIESYHGTDAARIVIYQSPWFSLLLLLLGINVAAAALDRLPWKKKHAGFVITHLGIIIILFGSLVTQKLMIDGQLAVAEGDTEHRITTSEPLLYVFSEDINREWVIPLKKKAFPWHGRQEILTKDPALSLAILTDYPKARMRQEILPAGSGPAAVQVTLHNSFVNQTQWLVEKDAELGEASVGPAKLKFTDELLQENKGQAPKSGYLEFQFQKSNIQIPVDENVELPATYPLEGTPFKVTVTKRFKNAVVEGSRLVEQETQEKTSPSMQNQNPAVQLTLEGEGIHEEHTVFTNFPEFPTLHGMKPSAANVKIFYRMPNAGSKGETHEMRFVYQRSNENGPEKKGKLLYQIQNGFDVKTGQAAEGDDVPTGWMDLAFHIGHFYSYSKIERSFNPEPNTSTSQEVLPAILLEVKAGGGDWKVLWLRQGLGESIKLGDTTYHILYGERRIPAGFRIQLRDFRVENYPGTNRPASFESDVTLKDDSRGVIKNVTISMNKPLVYRGFRIYQSGYNIEEGQPEVSIFSVGRDPGVPVKYMGAIVMVLGIITMFYTRRFSTQGGRIQ